MSPSPAVCREETSALEAASASVAEMVLLALERTRANDLRCGPPSQTVRVCRALFALSVVDPAHSLDAPEELVRTNRALSWVLQDAAAIAKDATLATALLQLDALNTELIATDDDRIRAEILQRRAKSEIVDPIHTAWLRCS